MLSGRSTGSTQSVSGMLRGKLSEGGRTPETGPTVVFWADIAFARVPDSVIEHHSSGRICWATMSHISNRKVGSMSMDNNLFQNYRKLRSHRCVIVEGVRVIAFRNMDHLFTTRVRLRNL